MATLSLALRKIIHIDMDAFFASVEQRDQPLLKGKPVIVGGKPEKRGVVAACSYEARAFGIHSAMPSSRAVKLCPSAVFLPPRFEAYREASAQIHTIFRQFTKLIEPLSLDEAYLDVTELAQRSVSATEIAKEIKAEIQRVVNLTASAGVSYNKFLAKIASDMDKPNGLFVIRPEQAEEFIEGLPIRKFHGIGKVTEQKMHKLGVFSGSDLKAMSQTELNQHFGQVGEHYFRIARGVDNRAVSASRERKSVGKETTFAEDLIDKKQIWDVLARLSESVSSSLLKKQLTSRTVILKVRYADFKSITRSKTLETTIQTTEQIMHELPELLRKTEVGTKPIRLIGVTCSNIESGSSGQDGTAQLGLF